MKRADSKTEENNARVREAIKILEKEPSIRKKILWWGDVKVVFFENWTATEQMVLDRAEHVKSQTLAVRGDISATTDTRPKEVEDGPAKP